MSKASLNDALRDLGGRLADRLALPRVSGLYLPPPVSDETLRDAFGFVLLDNGSVGPFYVSLGGLLRTLWQRHPNPRTAAADVHQLLDGFGSSDMARRALAVGCYNALGAALLRGAGLVAAERQAAAREQAAPADTIGMVGYFAPLIARYLANGIQVKVLELAPQRVDIRPGVQAVRDAGELRCCSRVLCTASTLVNDSLPDLLDALQGEVPVELIGPSASGLPDPLFERGVVAVGGTAFGHSEALLAQLDAGHSWGEAGHKYRLERDSYPGQEALLARLVGKAGNVVDADQA